MNYPNLVRVKQVFGDTSFFYATLNEKDPNHSIAIEISKFCDQKKITIVTTWEIINESITLLRTRYSYAKTIYFIEEIIPDLQWVLLTQEDREQCLRLFKKFSKDKELSLCDVISYFVVTKKLGKKTPCLSFDDDFKSLGLFVVA